MMAYAIPSTMEEKLKSMCERNYRIAMANGRQKNKASNPKWWVNGGHDQIQV